MLRRKENFWVEFENKYSNKCKTAKFFFSDFLTQAVVHNYCIFVRNVSDFSFME